MGISFDGGPAGEPGRGLIYQGLTCRRRIWRRASLFIVTASLGTWGERGCPFTGNFEI